jgi:RNA polymerase sigma-70 factor (ECF subfamily)
MSQTAAEARELHDRVLRYVARRVRNPQDAEDIAQEVMLRVHDRHGRLQDATAWAYRVAANAIADHYRRPVRRELPAGDAVDVAPGATEPESRSGGPQGLLAGCVPPMLQRMPPLYRQALELTELGGISQVDAAAELEISVSGMKARVQRARRQLGALIEDCCHVELDVRRAVVDDHTRGADCGSCAQR